MARPCLGELWHRERPKPAAEIVRPGFVVLWTRGISTDAPWKMGGWVTDSWCSGEMLISWLFFQFLQLMPGADFDAMCYTAMLKTGIVKRAKNHRGMITSISPCQATWGTPRKTARGHLGHCGTLSCHRSFFLAARLRLEHPCDHHLGLLDEKKWMGWDRRLQTVPKMVNVDKKRSGKIHHAIHGKNGFRFANCKS